MTIFTTITTIRKPGFMKHDVHDAPPVATGIASPIFSFSVFSSFVFWLAAGPLNFLSSYAPRLVSAFNAYYRNCERVCGDIQRGICVGLRSGIYEDENETD